jgi:hypothetical protein
MKAWPSPRHKKTARNGIFVGIQTLFCRRATSRLSRRPLPATRAGSRAAIAWLGSRRCGACGAGQAPQSGVWEDLRGRRGGNARRKRGSMLRLVRAPWGIGREGLSGPPAPSSAALASGPGGTSPAPRCRTPARPRLRESRRAQRPDVPLDPRKLPAGHAPTDRPYWDVRSGAWPGGAS